MSTINLSINAEDDNWVEVSKPKKEHPVKRPAGKHHTNGNANRGHKQSKALKNENKSRFKPKSDNIMKHDKDPSGAHTVSNIAKTVQAIESITTDDRAAESVSTVNATQTKPTTTVNAWASSNILTTLKPSDADDVDTVLGEAVSKLSVSDRSEAVKEVFCTTCRRFDDSNQQLMTFHVRGLVNTGCACFRNCIFQSLLALRPFVALVSSLLRAVPDPNQLPPDALPAWRELLTLMQEFASADSGTYSVTQQIQGAAASVVSGSKSKSGKGDSGSTKNRVPSISANLYMSSLFAAFQRNINASRPAAPPKLFSLRGSSKGAVGTKTTQEDAMEFLTFLLDALHEEVVAAERALLDAKAQTDAVASDIYAADVESSSSALTSESTTDTVEIDDCEPDGHAGDNGWNRVTKTKIKTVVSGESLAAARKAADASVINALFHGTLRSEVNYRSKRLSSVTFQRFFTLTLDIQSTIDALAAVNAGHQDVIPVDSIAAGPSFAAMAAAKASGAPVAGSGKNAVSVEQCMDAYFAEEVLVEGETRKQLSLDVLPPVLVLQLSRFGFNYHKMVPVKVMAEVQYPMELRIPERHMSPELAARTKRAGGAQYELSSVVLHHGDKAASGHYSTYSRQVSSEPKGFSGDSSYGGGGGVAADSRVWRVFNDTKVSVVGEQQVLAAQSMAYILFYTKKD